ncbi:MAG: PAS domain S-box protein [Ignavibacteriae bacterium]|nr:PAS domain S-box protein [Ignavibacteriota bacterium]
MITDKIKILFIEDNEDDFSLMMREFKKAPFEIDYTLIDNAINLETELNKEWDIIISDYALPGFNGYEALKICNKRGIEVPFIVVSGTVGEDIAVDMMKSGAKDYIMKKNLARLVPAVQRELKDAENRRKSKFIKLEKDVLFAINREILFTKNIDELFERIHENVKKVIFAENCFIALYDSENDEISFPFFRDKFDKKPAPMKNKKTLTDYVIRTGNSLICNKEDFNKFAKKNGLESIGADSESWLGVPLIISGKPIGVFTVQSYDSNIRYDEDHKNFLEAIASDIAISIERKISMEILAENEERFRKISSTISDISYSCSEDKNGKFSISWITGAYEKILGYNYNEMMELKCWGNLVIKEDSGIFTENVINLKSGEKAKCELRLLSKNNKVVWIESNAECFENIETNNLVIIGSIVDITQRKDSDDLIRKTLAQQNLILNSQSIIFYTTSVDKDFKTTWISEQVEEITGYPGKLFTDDNCFWSDRIHPDDKQNTLKKYSSVLDNGSSEIEYRWECADKKYRWFLDKISISFDDKGNPKEIIGIWLDITNRKQTEQNLIESREQLKEAQRIGKIGNWEWIPSENKVIWSDEMYEIFGIEKGKSITTEASINAFHPDDRNLVIKKTQEAIEKKKPVIIEARLLRPDGEIRYVYGSGEMFYDEKGEIARMVGIYQDITERKIYEDSLRKSEERFKLASLASNDVIYDWDVAKKEGWFSDNYHKVFGYKEKTVKFDEFKKNIHPDDVGNSLSITEPIIYKGGSTWTCDYRFRRADGTYAYVIDSGYVMRDNEGKPVRLIGSLMDFTERKWAEESLKKSEEHYRTLLRSIPDLMFRLDSKGRIIDYHAEDESVLFETPEKFLGKHYYDVLPENISALFKKVLKETKETGEIGKFEYVGFLKDNSVHNYEARVTNYEEETVVIIRDITDQKKAEREVKESEERFRRLFEDSSFGIALVGSDLKFLRVNKGFCEMIGYTESELSAMTFKEITHPDYLSNDILNVEKLFKGEINLYNTEKKYIKKDKTAKWGEVNVTIVKNNEGDFLYLLAMIEDITARKLAEEAVKESEEHFKNIVRNAEAAYFRIDNKGIFEEVNNSWLKMHKYDSQEEIIGKHFAVTQIDSDIETAKQIVNSLLKGKPIETGEFSRKCKDGSVGYHTFSISPVITKGKIAGIEGFLIDITEQKSALDALKESQERYKILIETMNEGLILVDNNDEIQFINKRGCEIYGYEPEELIGRRGYQILVYEEDRDIIINKNISRQSDISDSYDVRGKTKKGEIIWLNISGAPVKDKDGKVIGSVGLISDITERKIAEEDLIKLSRAVQQSPASIVITDLKGNIEYVNPKFVEVTGYLPEEAIGKNPRILKSGEKSSEEYKELWDTISAGNDWFGEFHNKKKNGDFYWEFASISPIRKSDGVITHYLAVKEDITDKKEKELELIKAKEKAEESERLKSSFLANMSHELRTPMVGILGFSELIKNITDNNELIDFADNIAKSGKRLLETLNLILDLSRIEAGRVEVKTSEANIVQLAKEVFNNYLNEAKKKNLNLTFECQEESITSKIDERMVFESINNLVNNALKYTKRGEICLAVKSDKQKGIAKIKVSDTGIGIAKENLNVIFEEFRQVSEGYSRSFEGTGLGLTITKNFVEKNGGKIFVESELGIGTVFSIELPLSKSEKVSYRQAKEISAEIPEFEHKDVEILCVDDDSFTREYLEYILKGKYNVYFAEDGVTAIEISKTRKFSLILMDINLGKGMDGVETTRKIHKLPGYEGIPVIAMTAFAMVGDKEEFLQNGMNDYISKPFKSNELIKLVELSLSKNKK